MEQSYRKNDTQQRVVKIAAAIDKLSQVVAVNCDFQKAGRCKNSVCLGFQSRCLTSFGAIY